MTSRDYKILVENYQREYYHYNRLIAREILPSKRALLRSQRDEVIKQIEIIYTKYINSQALEQKERERKQCKQLIN